MNNTQKIIEVLMARGPLDDGELAMHSGVFPRQQVNQICRRLQVKGILSRVPSHTGKIVNVLKQRKEFESEPTSVEAREEVGTTPPRGHALLAENCEWNLENSDPEKTLLVICCSKHKAPGSIGPGGPSILDYLPGSVAERLHHARRALAPRAHLDESTLLPAWRLYNGHFFRAATQVLARTVGEPPRVVIVSGGYGLLLADERIGVYDRRFRQSDWPEGVLEEVVLDFVERQGLGHVRAFASETTDYAKLLRAISWRDVPIEDAWLFSAAGPKDGAQIKVPRTQGEAFVALIEGRLSKNWRSSDDLTMNAAALV